MPDDARKSECRLRICAIGIGGAGCAMADELATRQAAIRVLAMHTDRWALESLGIEQTLLLGEAVTGGHGTGGDTRLASEAAEASSAAVAAAVADADLVFLMAGGGGGTSGGVAPRLAAAAREQGACVLSFVSQPFSFEGASRARRASSLIADLKQLCDGVFVLPNDRLLGERNDPQNLEQSLAVVRREWARWTETLSEVLLGRSVLSLDLGDIRQLARRGNGLLTMVAVEARGPRAPESIVEQALNHPLLADGRLLAGCRGLLLGICGGSQLSLEALQSIVDPLRRKVAAEVVQTVGAVVSSQRDDDLCLALCLAGGGGDELSDETSPVEANAQRAEEERPRRGSSAVRNGDRQGRLNLQGGGLGRFKDVEPSIYGGEDLDVPTFLRRGIKISRR